MIFLTVGTQLGFDRLVRAVDRWCARRPQIKVFGQIGSSSYRPTHFAAVEWMDRAEYARHLRAAQGVVSHAGMGTIMQCQDEDKPLLVLPRRASLGECINEHQVTMARKLDRLGLIHVAYDERDLPDALDRLPETRRTPRTQDHRAGLIAHLSAYINGIETPPPREPVLRPSPTDG